MRIPDSLLCLFSAEVERRDGSVMIEIPESEVRDGAVTPGEVYKTALLSRSNTESMSEESTSEESSPEQPVQEGDVLDVEIEDIGEQGDGIARVGPGFVVIVPETGVGDRVTVEITDVGDTVAFADVRERSHSVA